MNELLRSQLTLSATDHAPVLEPAGVIVYHGPRDDIIPFFASLGFELPERKGAADFLQEITSRKDQKVSAQTALLVMTKSFLSRMQLTLDLQLYVVSSPSRLAISPSLCLCLASQPTVMDFH